MRAKLTTCSGDVVINMTRYCLIRRPYTTGNCSVPGVPRY
jgi:hypothetical protein